MNGDDTEAERCFRMFLELDPDNGHVLLQLVTLSVARGANQEAMELLIMILEKCPNDQGLWNLLTNISNQEGKG